MSKKESGGLRFLVLILSVCSPISLAALVFTYLTYGNDYGHDYRNPANDAQEEPLAWAEITEGAKLKLSLDEDLEFPERFDEVSGRVVKDVILKNSWARIDRVVEKIYSVPNQKSQYRYLVVNTSVGDCKMGQAEKGLKSVSAPIYVDSKRQSTPIGNMVMWAPVNARKVCLVQFIVDKYKAPNKSYFVSM